MARFLNGLNEEISGFVEMFPYNNLQALVQQAIRTERRADGGHMAFNLFQLHGVDSKLEPLLLEVDLKVLQLGLLHLLVLQRWRFLLHLHL